MRPWLFLLTAFTCPLHAGTSTELAEKAWIHGSADCAANRDPPIEVHAFDADTYILRQNKCVHFEAPFIYVLFGRHTVFVQDTGATAEAERFPLYETVNRLVAQRGRPETRILVTHSHGHGDHKAADAQFRGRPGVTLIEPDIESVREYFGFTAWPEGLAKIDLGERVLEVMPAPGHQDAAVAVYDSRTGWLLTGDSVYPGRLYVKNWNEYRASIARLAEFSKTRPISAVLGTHIEMSGTGRLFAVGSTFQPDEASLVLTAEDLSQLHQALQKAGDESQEMVMPKFSVVPLGWFWRVLSDVMGWLGFY